MQNFTGNYEVIVKVSEIWKLDFHKTLNYKERSCVVGKGPSSEYDSDGGLFCGMVDPWKCLVLTLPLSQNYATSIIRAFAEPEFRYCWMKLCVSNNH